MRVAIMVFPGVEEMDFVAPWEVFCVARTMDASLEAVDLCSHPHAESVRAFHGLQITGVKPLEGRYDLIIIPGGAWLAGGDVGVRKAIADDLSEALRQRHAEGTVLASICTGAFVLAAAGLLDGRRAATHHSARQDLLQYGASVSTARVVDAGDLLSAGGVTAGLDLSLWLIERFCGRALAEKTESYLEYTRQGEVERLPS